MGSYRHLSREDREQIAVLRAAGHSSAGIAAALGRAPSTISRELKRNALDSGRSSAQTADGACLLRRQRTAILERDKRLARFVRIVDYKMTPISPPPASIKLNTAGVLCFN